MPSIGSYDAVLVDPPAIPVSITAGSKFDRSECCGWRSVANPSVYCLFADSEELGGIGNVT